MAGCGDGRVGVWTGGKDGLACGPCWRVRLPSEEQEGLAGGEMLNWRQRSLDLIKHEELLSIVCLFCSTAIYGVLCPQHAQCWRPGHGRHAEP